jgi:hypothetical protein
MENIVADYQKTCELEFVLLLNYWGKFIALLPCSCFKFLWASNIKMNTCSTFSAVETEVTWTHAVAALTEDRLQWQGASWSLRRGLTDGHSIGLLLRTRCVRKCNSYSLEDLLPGAQNTEAGKSVRPSSGRLKNSWYALNIPEVTPYLHLPILPKKMIICSVLYPVQLMCYPSDVERYI